MVMAGEGDSETAELVVADHAVGQLRYRPRGEPPPAALLRLVSNLIGLELERSKAPARRARPQWATSSRTCSRGRSPTARTSPPAPRSLGCDLASGRALLVVGPARTARGGRLARARPHPRRARARGVERESLAALVGPLAPPGGRPRRGGRRRSERELVILSPGADASAGRRVATAILRELDASLPGFAVTVARSRHTAEPADLHRAGAEALLAANVAEARGQAELSFEETGAYRLLLPAMSEDPSELQGFFQDTVAPLVAYDDQYETELVRTLETFLDADGNVAGTAERLFTHRHTIRYRLERVKELTGLDVGSTDGRERLSLGLKAMRVLGIVPPGGPAHERGNEAGRVPRGAKDR